MKNSNEKAVHSSAIERILKNISARRRAPLALFFVILLVYLATSIFVSVIAASEATVTIAENRMNVSAFTGVFAALANICIIFMVVYYGKLGLATSLSLMLIQYPMIIVTSIKRQNISNLPGIFTNVLTLIAIIIIHYNNLKIDQYQDKLRSQAVTDRLTNLPNRFDCTELVNDIVKQGEKFVVV